MIDTHCHLDVARFDADRPAVLDRAWAAGLTGIIVPAIGPESWESLLTWPMRDERIQVGLGIHPQLLPRLPPEDDERHLRTLDQLLTRGGAIAVGECGLDGGTGELERQEAIFRAHLRAAKAIDRPVVIHVLRAHDAAPRILREEGPVRGVLHSYSGGAALVPVYRDLGMAFSFAGPVSYANARRPVEAARAIDAELLLVETDAPDQAPEGHRGGRSEPAFLPAVIAGLAAACDRTIDEIAALTTANALRIFGSWAPPEGFL